MIIPIDTQLKEFEKYLEIHDRCIFSARFGDGKSFFLTEFMDRYKDNYLFIPVYPVNYQVAENKDIFEYIKRDILIRLITSEGACVDDNSIKKTLLLWNYLTNNPVDIATTLLKILPDINLLGIEFSFEKTIGAINNLREKFKEHSAKFKTEADKLEEYFTEYDGLKGSIYEFDAISQLICDLNDRFRLDNQNKKIILLIEDLDRIDPAHIFRILNIFSAHFDRPNTSLAEIGKTVGHNKFKFDKIITVCHYENIKNIYAHMYGSQTDFSGYIDKFSSAKPFYYSLKRELGNFISKHINNHIKPYNYTCEVLTDMILEKYGKQITETNLRQIKSRLMLPIAIKDETLLVLNEYEISTINPLTMLLDLLNRFELKAEHFVNKLLRKEDSLHRNSPIRELHQIIGVCWLYLQSIESQVIFYFDEYSNGFIAEYQLSRDYLFKAEIADKKVTSLNTSQLESQNRGAYAQFVNFRMEIINVFNQYIINSKE